MAELKPCPFGADHRVWIAVHDDEGNCKGEPGCDYESDPWSGLTYGLHHEGWGTCPLCTDGDLEAMGGMLFDTPEEAAETWNTRQPIGNLCSSAKWQAGECLGYSGLDDEPLDMCKVCEKSSAYEGDIE